MHGAALRLVRLGASLGLSFVTSFCFSCYWLTVSGDIFAEPVFVSALLLLRLAHVTGQELFPLVSYGLVGLMVVLVDAANVLEPQSILDDAAGMIPAVSDVLILPVLVLTPVEEIVEALQDVVAHKRVIAVVKCLLPLIILSAEILREITDIQHLIFPWNLDHVTVLELMNCFELFSR